MRYFWIGLSGFSTSWQGTQSSEAWGKRMYPVALEMLHNEPFKMEWVGSCLGFLPEKSLSFYCAPDDILKCCIFLCDFLEGDLTTKIRQYYCCFQLNYVCCLSCSYLIVVLQLKDQLLEMQFGILFLSIRWPWSWLVVLSKPHGWTGVMDELVPQLACPCCCYFHVTVDVASCGL